MQGLALLVQQGLKRNPLGGDLFVFRGRAGSLIKIIWHDGIGMSLYAKRLEKGRFVWPSASEGTVSLKGKTDVARLCVYARDDRPFAGTDPPAALFHYSRNRRGEHPQTHLKAWSGILQADAYSGYTSFIARAATPVPCWKQAALPMRGASSSSWPMS